MRLSYMLLAIVIYLQNEVIAGAAGVGGSDIVADAKGSTFDFCCEEGQNLAHAVSSFFKNAHTLDYQKKSIDDVFTQLKSTNAGNKLFENPKLLTWLNYADDFTFKYGKEASPIATLTARYGDETLAQMILAARGWFLSSPELSNWIKNLKLFNNKYSDKKTTLIATLSTTYGGEGLIKILDAAKKATSTNHLATNLDRALVQYWLDTRRSTAEVFTLLVKLQKEGDNLILNPLFTNWIRYVDDYHLMYPKEKAI
ncbi:unnamed protein product [Phytophthora lilii]|uniref:Unnamed protein product n=1 Tax=Phytophthora lilii TaxID=2077276 RepID=A0A9W6U810_9STRA|nr:unnamed protein product [Phytophthora lilii]